MYYKLMVKEMLKLIDGGESTCGAWKKVCDLHALDHNQALELFGEYEDQMTGLEHDASVVDAMVA